jgi:hypothetical protein
MRIQRKVNLALLTEQLAAAQAKFEAIKATQYKAFTDRLAKDKLTEIAFRSFDEYKKADG